MKDWFNSLEQRERWILGIGVPVALVLIVKMFVWNPLSSGTTQLRDSVSQKERLIAELYRADAYRGASASGPATPRATTMSVLVTNTAQAQGVQGINQVRTPSDNEAQVSFSNASFDSLTDLLVSLSVNDGVVVETLNAGRSSRAEGLVSGQAHLRRY